MTSDMSCPARKSFAPVQMNDEQQKQIVSQAQALLVTFQQCFNAIDREVLR
jgi:hypothetical protein